MIFLFLKNIRILSVLILQTFRFLANFILHQEYHLLFGRQVKSFSHIQYILSNLLFYVFALFKEKDFQVIIIKKQQLESVFMFFCYVPQVRIQMSAFLDIVHKINQELVSQAFTLFKQPLKKLLQV